MDWTNRDSASKIFLVSVLIIIGVIVLSVFFWGGTGYGMMGGGMIGTGWLVILILLLLFIALIFFVVPGLSEETHPAQGYSPSGTPQPFKKASESLDILSQRYARGEISRDDYLRMRDDILSGNECNGKF